MPPSRLKERFGICHMTGRLACQLVMFLGEEPEDRPRIAPDLKGAGSLANVTVVALLGLYLLFLGMRRKKLKPPSANVRHLALIAMTISSRACYVFRPGSPPSIPQFRFRRRLGR